MEPKDLQAVYDRRKSFYGKAKVIEDNNILTLSSYNLPICKIVKGKVIPLAFQEDISTTTLRHLKDFLKQNDFFADTKQQIIKDYGFKKGE